MCAGGSGGASSDEATMLIYAACLLGAGDDRGLTGSLSLFGINGSLLAFVAVGKCRYTPNLFLSLSASNSISGRPSRVLVPS